MGDQQIISAKKTPKLIFVLFFLFFLVVAAEGAYYLYLQKFKTPSQEEQFDIDEISPEQMNLPPAPEGLPPSYQDLIEKYPISGREGVYYGDDKSFNLLGKVVEVDTTERKVVVQVYNDVLEIYYSDSSQRIIKKGAGMTFEQFSPEKINEGDWITFVVSRNQNGKFILKLQA